MAIGGIDTALSGLRVAQQQLDVIANNVSNVNTPGYTRKILPQETIALEGRAVGVSAQPIIRNVDLNLSRDFWTQVSSVEALDVQAKFLDKIQQFHGSPDQEISVAAELAELRDDFAALADTPEDSFLQRNVVDQAGLVANKINDLAGLITQIRNDTQDEMAVSVEEINRKLELIAEINQQIKFNKTVGKTTATLEDSRDQAIKELSGEIEISFFTRGDGVLVVQTARGVQLADERAETVFFEKNALGPTTFFPDPANPDVGGIFVGGDPDEVTNAIDITQTGLNGKLGGLIELRDEIMPRQQALLDELAHKLAFRFEAQGLRLFTDASGAIPADTAPDPTIPTPVEYVGFSTEIQVNQLIVDNNALIQQGTVATDRPVQSGSNEVVRRIVEFTFGDIDYQEAQGAIDLRASGAADTLQNWLGIYSQNQVTGTRDLTQFSDTTALMAAGGDIFQPPAAPITDTFRLSFSEDRIGISEPPLAAGVLDFDISLAAAAAQPGANAAEQIAAEINAQVAARIGVEPLVADLDIVASVSPFGELIIETRGEVDVDANFAGGMGDDGLAFLGLEAGTFETTDPYFDIQVGNDPPVRVTIEPGEDENDLTDKLDLTLPGDPAGGAAGLGVELDPTTGFLRLRPGDDTSNPTFGGDLKIVGGPFDVSVAGTGPDAQPVGAGILAALFGTDDPVSNIAYASPTSTPGVTVPFRSRELGPGANIDTGIISSSSLIDYAQKMVNRQAEDSITTEARRGDEQSFRDLLQRRLLDESAVNIEEELSNLIRIQTAFSAAARVVTAIDEELQELLNAF